MSVTTLVIPVCNESPVVVRTVLEEAQRFNWPVVLVDDGSTPPLTLPSPLPSNVRVVRHPVTCGYGAALKTGIRQAKTPWVATLDGDGQHRAWDVKRLEEFLAYFDVDMAVGDRRLKDHGLRLWGRKALNWTAALFAGQWIPDLNSGMRIFQRQIALGYEPILCDGFSYTTTLVLAMLVDGYQVDWLPIKVWPRVQGQSKVLPWRDGWTTLRCICWIGLALRSRRVREVKRRWERAIVGRLQRWLT